MEITNEIKVEAKKLKAMGSPMSIEAIETMLQKKANKKNKKSAKNWAKRDKLNAIVVEECEGSAGDWLAAKNRENAMNNLPSSLR